MIIYHHHLIVFLHQVLITYSHFSAEENAFILQYS
jgi:hypothetical protein